MAEDKKKGIVGRFVDKIDDKIKKKADCKCCCCCNKKEE